jgi:hypothetical protein
MRRLSQSKRQHRRWVANIAVEDLVCVGAAMLATPSAGETGGGGIPVPGTGREHCSIAKEVALGRRRWWGRLRRGRRRLGSERGGSLTIGTLTASRCGRSEHQHAENRWLPRPSGRAVSAVLPESRCRHGPLSRHIWVRIINEPADKSTACPPAFRSLSISPLYLSNAARALREVYLRRGDES